MIQSDDPGRWNTQACISHDFWAQTHHLQMKMFNMGFDVLKLRMRRVKPGALVAAHNMLGARPPKQEMKLNALNFQHEQIHPLRWPWTHPPRTKQDRTRHIRHIRLLSLGGRWSTKGPGHRRFPGWGSDGNNNLVRAPSLYKPPPGDFRRGPPVCAALWEGSSEVTERRSGWWIQ